MGKGHYIVGFLLIGVAGYLLFNQIKKGNTIFKSKDDDFVEAELGSHLNPPSEVV